MAQLDIQQIPSSVVPTCSSFKGGADTAPPPPAQAVPIVHRQVWILKMFFFNHRKKTNIVSGRVNGKITMFSIDLEIVVVFSIVIFVFWGVVLYLEMLFSGMKVCVFIIVCVCAFELFGSTFSETNSPNLKMNGWNFCPFLLGWISGLCYPYCMRFLSTTIP